MRRCCFLTLSYKDAELELKRRQIEVEEIKLGLRQVSLRKTFQELCDYWIKHKVPRKRSGKDDLSIIRNHLLPFFKETQLSKLIRPTDQVNRYMDLKSHLSKKTVINHFTLLCAMLNHAYSLGWIQSKPIIQKPKQRIFSKDYSYLRSQKEIDIFLNAALQEAPEHHSLYVTAIYTGMRQGELAGLKWSDIDFDQRHIVCQRSYDGPTKAEDVRYIPIFDPLLPILLSLKNSRNRHPVYLFTNSAGNRHTVSARVFKQVFHRILDRAGFEKPNTKQAHYIRFHDLRHTFASHYMLRGGDIFKLKEILGHKDIRMTQRYAHIGPNAFKNEYGRMGTAHVNTVIPFTPFHATKTIS